MVNYQIIDQNFYDYDLFTYFEKCFKTAASTIDDINGNLLAIGLDSRMDLEHPEELKNTEYQLGVER